MRHRPVAAAALFAIVLGGTGTIEPLTRHVHSLLTVAAAAAGHWPSLVLMRTRFRWLHSFIQSFIITRTSA